MTPKRAASRMRSLPAKLKRAANQADKRAAREAYKEGRIYSSGTLTVQDKRNLDYPYATRHGGSRVPGDPAIINVVTGQFKASWAIQPTPDGFETVNVDDVGRWLKHGTPKMISRPIEQRIYERVNPYRLVWLKDALRRALR